MKKKLIVGTILLASIIGLVALNLVRSGSRPTVSLVEAETGVIRESVYASGTLAAAETADHYVPYSGVVERVFVKAGDRVKKGDPLFVMEAATLENQIRLEENSLAMIRAEERMYRESRLEAARRELAEGREPEDVFDENELELYRLRIERSMLMMESLREQLEKREVRAELDGVVSALHVKTGQPAAEGTVAVTLVDDLNLEAVARLNQLDAGKVKEGMEAVISGDSFDQELAGTVSFVSPIAVQADASSRDPYLEIRVKLSDVPDVLKPGLTVSLEIVLPAEPRVLVPLTAVRFTADGARVYEVKDGRALARSVTAGRDDGERVEILSGLSAGERVIAAPGGDITDGTPVNVHD